MGTTHVGHAIPYDAGIPIDIKEQQELVNERTSLVIPGSEQDDTFGDETHEEKAARLSLDEHTKAAELDHPQGSVQLRHLETQVRALLEALIQGDDEAVFREKARFEETAIFEKAVTFESTINAQGAADFDAAVNMDGTLQVDGNTTVDGNLYLGTQGGDKFILIGPNDTSSRYLKLGVSGTGAQTEAAIFATDGNLHIEAKDGKGIYLGYYSTDDVRNRVFLGESGTCAIYDWNGDNAYAAITHEGRGTEKGATDYGLLISTTDTYLNAAAGSDVYIRQNNVTLAKFDEDGVSLASGDWFRSTGPVGWYNETYAGGVDMHDVTYIRIHGGKRFHVENQISSSTIHLYTKDPGSRSGYLDIGEPDDADPYRPTCRQTGGTTFRLRYLGGW